MNRIILAAAILLVCSTSLAATYDWTGTGTTSSTAVWQISGGTTQVTGMPASGSTLQISGGTITQNATMTGAFTLSSTAENGAWDGNGTYISGGTLTAASGITIRSRFDMVGTALLAITSGGTATIPPGDALLLEGSSHLNIQSGGLMLLSPTSSASWSAINEYTTTAGIVINANGTLRCVGSSSVIQAITFDCQIAINGVLDLGTSCLRGCNQFGSWSLTIGATGVVMMNGCSLYPSTASIAPAAGNLALGSSCSANGVITNGSLAPPSKGQIAHGNTYNWTGGAGAIAGTGFSEANQSTIASGTTLTSDGLSIAGTFTHAADYTAISGVAAATDVRYNVARYSGGTSGSCHVPDTTAVLLGQLVDAGTGSYVPATAGNLVINNTTGAGAFVVVGTYPTSATTALAASNAQYAGDQAAVTAARAGIYHTTTILAVAGTAGTYTEGYGVGVLAGTSSGFSAGQLAQYGSDVATVAGLAGSVVSPALGGSPVLATTGTFAVAASNIRAGVTIGNTAGTSPVPGPGPMRQTPHRADRLYLPRKD